MTISPDDAVRDPRSAAVPVCYRHADRETYLRCHRCERYICTDCMITAAVGHQCPECVRGGNRTVRQARTSVGGRVRARQGVVTISLIAVNAAMFGMQHLAGNVFTYRLNLWAIWGFSSYIPSDSHIGVANGEWYRLLTAMFLHVSVAHIVMNMLSLYWIGIPVEQRLGRIRYLLAYLVCGICGSGASYLFMDRYSAPSEGASGAIFGLLGVLAVLAYRERLNIQPVVTVIVINLAFGFAVPGIDWHAHIGGLVSGAVLGAAFAYAPRPRGATSWFRNPQILVPLGTGLALLVATVVIVSVHTSSLLDSSAVVGAAPLVLGR